MNITLFQNGTLISAVLILLDITINVIIQNKIMSKIFNIKIKKLEKTLIPQIIFVYFLRVKVINQYQIIAFALVQLVIFKIILKINIDKLIISEKTNLFLCSIIYLITFKVNQILEGQINNIFASISMVILAITIHCIFYAIICKFNIKMEIPEYTNSKTKIEILLIGILSSTIIIANQVIILKSINHLPISIIIIDLIMISSFSILVLVNINKIIQIETEKTKVNELEGNNTRLKESYEDICSFRHDMKNIMQGLGGYIAAKDMDGLTQMYNEFVCDCKEVENKKDFEELSKTNPAIYNIINNKYLEAKKYNININVEVYVDLNNLKIKIYELCRILGILIDNAIEATKECEDKQINIKFLKDRYNNRDLVIIENPYKNTLIDLSKINEKGFTTKKDKKFHGLGLWRVNKIIEKNENLRLTTSRENNKIFKQQLEIYNW